MFAPPRRCLEVTVGSTPSLKENRANNGGKGGAGSEPFAVVRLGQQQQRSDAGLPAGARSVWNHRFNFLLDDEEKDPEELGVEVWDRVDGEETRVGSCTVDLTPVFEDGSLEAVRPVHRRCGKLLGHIRFYLCLLVEDPSADLDSDSPPPFAREAPEPLPLCHTSGKKERRARGEVKEEAGSWLSSQVKVEGGVQPWSPPQSKIPDAPDAASAGALLQALLTSCLAGRRGQQGGGAASGDMRELLNRIQEVMQQPAKAASGCEPSSSSAATKALQQPQQQRGHQLPSSGSEQELRQLAQVGGPGQLRQKSEQVPRQQGQEHQQQFVQQSQFDQQQEQLPQEKQDLEEFQQQKRQQQQNVKERAWQQHQHQEEQQQWQQLQQNQQQQQPNQQQQQQNQQQQHHNHRQQQATKASQPSLQVLPCGPPEALLRLTQSLERQLMESPCKNLSPNQTAAIPATHSITQTSLPSHGTHFVPSSPPKEECGIKAGKEQAGLQQQQQCVISKPRPVHHQMLPPKSPASKVTVPSHELAALPGGQQRFHSVGSRGDASGLDAVAVLKHSGDGPAWPAQTLRKPAAFSVPGETPFSGPKKPPPLDVSFSSSLGHFSEAPSPSAYLQSPSLSCLITSPAPWSPLTTPSSAAVAAGTSCFNLMSPSSPFFNSAFGQRHHGGPPSALTHLESHGSLFSPPSSMSAVPPHMMHPSAGREQLQSILAMTTAASAAGHPSLDLSMMSPAPGGTQPSSSEHSGVTSTRSSGRLPSSQDEIAAALHKAFSPSSMSAFGETRDGFLVPRSPSVLRPNPSSPPKDLVVGERLKDADVLRLLTSVGLRPPALKTGPSTPTMGGMHSAFSSPRLSSPSSRTGPSTPRSSSSVVGPTSATTPTTPNLKRLHTVEEDDSLQLATPHGMAEDTQAASCPWRESKRARVVA